MSTVETFTTEQLAIKPFNNDNFFNIFYEII